MSSQSHVFPATLVESTPSPTVTSASLPWYCYAVAFAVACVPLGALWDISWHLSIGRDSFWTPAHMMIYMGGSIPGMVCGWLVLKNTFWSDPREASATVSVWGFRGPVGAWLVIWGAFMMILSAPFDNW
ncbi:MAG TPA: hypothetical protein VHZ30_03735, partial [Verrucomicrobiae bacterium]|nr:hypothetical protein [Verrucomicrobiae bacterium]